MPINASSDRLLKEMATLLLQEAGRVDTEQEVLPAAKRIDLWFTPDPNKAETRHTLGALGRMVDEPCLLEGFHNPPDLRTVLRCVTKQQLWWERMELDAAQAVRREAAESPSPSTGSARALTITLPPLWIVAGGLPKTALDKLGFQPMADWPEGFYEAADGWRVRIVATPQLPKDADTLALRLFGRGEVLENAVQQLVESRPGPSVWAEVIRRLGELGVVYSTTVAELSDVEKEFIMQTTKLIDAIERAAEERGRKEALELVERAKRDAEERGRKEALELVEHAKRDAEERGREEGSTRVLMDLIRLRLNRPLTETEESGLHAHLNAMAHEDVLKTIHAVDPKAIERWLIQASAPE